MDGYVKLVYNKPGTIQYSKTLFEQVYSDSLQSGLFLLLFQTSPFARGPRHRRSTLLPQVGTIIVILVRTRSLLYPGRHNLRSFLASNTTQNYVLIAHIFSFFVTFPTKVPYLTFYVKMGQILT